MPMTAPRAGRRHPPTPPRSPSTGPCRTTPRRPWAPGPRRRPPPRGAPPGRPVPRPARLLGHRATIYVPAGRVHPRAVRAIRHEGANVVEVVGNYDAAVTTAARAAEDDAGSVLVQDTAWEGYEQIPGWIVEGYSTLFAEIDDQLAERGLTEPDLVLVPTGVGSLLQAALTHYRGTAPKTQVAEESGEAGTAACVEA